MSEQLKRLLFIVAIFLPILIWPFCQVDINKPFQYAVPVLFKLGIIESSAYYGFIHLFSVLPVFLLSFDKKVRFYKSWKNLFPALGLVGMAFVVWDILFTKWNVWGFNESYFLGPKIFGLPVEEILFFVSIPFASLFVHACLIAYFPKDNLKKWDALISWILGLGLVTVGLWNFDRVYTSTSFLTAGVGMIVHYHLFENKYRTLFYRSFLIVLFPFIIVDGALTGWFSNAPIVLYNTDEFLGIRFGSVPLEDAIYGFFLLLLVTTFQDWFVTVKPSRT